jgi:hypothetical protein
VRLSTKYRQYIFGEAERNGCFRVLLVTKNHCLSILKGLRAGLGIIHSGNWKLRVELRSTLSFHHRLGIEAFEKSENQAHGERNVETEY